MKPLLLLLLTFGLISCNKQSAQELPESVVVAVVGDEAITTDLLKAYLTANGINQANDAILNTALDKLIEEIAMANIAKKKQLKISGDELNTLKYLKLKSLANAAKQDYLLDNVITNEEIKTQYDTVNNQVGGIEFHVHHLLFKDEVEAIKLLDNIKSVDDYKASETLYLSKNPKMRNVGDLGWVTLGQLPKSFREVLPQQKENSVLSQVLNSKFGAHVVYLEGIRKLQPPKFEDVKDGIIQSLKTKRISKFAQLAKAKAHVIIKE